MAAGGISLVAKRPSPGHIEDIERVASIGSHARASLSDGTVDIATCILTCPWHQGMFDLRTGKPAGGPPVVPLRTYEVTIDGNRAVIGPQPHSSAGTSASRA